MACFWPSCFVCLIKRENKTNIRHIKGEEQYGSDLHACTHLHIHKCLSRSKIRPELTRWRETDRSQIKTSLSRHKKKKRAWIRNMHRVELCFPLKVLLFSHNNFITAHFLPIKISYASQCQGAKAAAGCCAWEEGAAPVPGCGWAWHQAPVSHQNPLRQLTLSCGGSPQQPVKQGPKDYPAACLQFLL